MIKIKFDLSKKFPSKRVSIAVIIILLLFLSSIAVLIYSNAGKGINVNFTNIANNRGSSTDTEKLIKAVGKKFLLPTEFPTIATVSDKTQLTDQPFFAKAENGDKVLIYKGEKTAILYRPSIDKIINVGPVNLSDEGLESTSEGEELSSTDIIILNGTFTVGLTKIVADQFKDLDFVNLKDRLDTADKPYQNSLVVVLNDAVNEQAEIIASSLSARVISKLPEKEDDELEADIIIIVGEDYASSSSN